MLLITLTMALFKSSVWIASDSVTESWHAQTRKPKQLNGIKLLWRISSSAPVSFLLRNVNVFSEKGLIYCFKPQQTSSWNPSAFLCLLSDYLFLIFLISYKVYIDSYLNFSLFHLFYTICKYTNFNSESQECLLVLCQESLRLSWYHTPDTTSW